ncbi:7142_t:CDS:2 [Entrophospora sp. SA101]|nr:7142_t:CDS:2 [Entrophospora sp. SA101]
MGRGMAANRNYLQQPYFINHKSTTWPVGAEDGMVLDKGPNNKWLEH